MPKHSRSRSDSRKKTHKHKDKDKKKHKKHSRSQEKRRGGDDRESSSKTGLSSRPSHEDSGNGGHRGGY